MKVKVTRTELILKTPRIKRIRLNRVLSLTVKKKKVNTTLFV
jgi:hypothetical protein